MDFELAAITKIPYSFNCTYAPNFDVAGAHKYILSFFDSTKQERWQRARELYEKLQNLEPDSELEKQLRQQRLQAIAKQIQQIESAGDRNEYNLAVQNILTAFDAAKSEHEKLPVINDYFRVLAQYIHLNIEREVVWEAPLTSIKKKKSIENDLQNFVMGCRRFCGQQPDKTPPDLYVRIDGHFRSIGVHIRENILQLPLDRKGRRIGKLPQFNFVVETSVQLMCNALKAACYQKFYEDARLICAKYWNWCLPDIMHLVQQMSENFMKTQIIFEQIKTRKSNFNIEYLIWKHLELVGFDCEMSDFSMVSTDVLIAYEPTWKQMVLGAGLCYNPVF